MLNNLAMAPGYDFDIWYSEKEVNAKMFEDQVN